MDELVEVLLDKEVEFGLVEFGRSHSNTSVVFVRFEDLGVLPASNVVDEVSLIGNQTGVELENGIAPNGSPPKHEFSLLEIDIDFQDQKEEVYFLLIAESDGTVGRLPTPSHVVETQVSLKLGAELDQSDSFVERGSVGMRVDDRNFIGRMLFILVVKTEEDLFVVGDEVEFMEGELGEEFAEVVETVREIASSRLHD